jgi:hypothetical protein
MVDAAELQEGGSTSFTLVVLPMIEPRASGPFGAPSSAFMLQMLGDRRWPEGASLMQANICLAGYEIEGAQIPIS